MAKTTIFFLLLVNLIWSATLYLEPTHTTIFNYLYNISYGLSFGIAGIISFLYIKKYPLNIFIWRTVILSTCFFFMAQLIWVYYNTVLQSEVPFPSLADIFWILFYITNIGMTLSIFKSLKIGYSYRNLLEIIFIFGILFTISNSFVAINTDFSESSQIVNILNVMYPLFDSLLVAFFLIIIRSSEGRFKPALLFFTTAFFAFTIGDSLFTYQTSLNTYWNGNFVDAIFAISGYFYSIGIFSLPQILNTTNASQTLTTQDI